MQRTHKIYRTKSIEEFFCRGKPWKISPVTISSGHGTKQPSCSTKKNDLKVCRKQKMRRSTRRSNAQKRITTNAPRRSNRRKSRKNLSLRPSDMILILPVRLTSTKTKRNRTEKCSAFQLSAKASATRKPAKRISVRPKSIDQSNTLFMPSTNGSNQERKRFLIS